MGGGDLLKGLRRVREIKMQTTGQFRDQ